MKRSSNKGRDAEEELRTAKQKGINEGKVEGKAEGIAEGIAIGRSQRQG